MRLTASRCTLALGFILLAACAAPAGKPATAAAAAPEAHRRILVDASRDGGGWWFPQKGPFAAGSPHQGKALADYLRSQGHTVTELPRPTTVTAELLAGADIVIRSGGSGAYTETEIDAYDHWVKGGGRLLLLSDVHPNDALAERFGLKFEGTALAQGSPVKTTVAKFAPHPLTHGVRELPFLGGSGLTAYPSEATLVGWLARDNFLDLNDNKTQDAGEPEAPPVLGVMPFGQGKIVFCGDINLWEAVPQPLVQQHDGLFRGALRGRLGPERRAFFSRAFAASTSRLRGAACVTSEASSVWAAAATCFDRRREGGLVRLRGLGEAADLPHELQRRGAHLAVGDRRLEIEQGLDVSAHAASLAQCYPSGMSIRPVKRLIKAKPTLEGAGVHLRRAFGFGNTSDFDPFLLLDDFRNDVPEDYLAGFPWHPHRGIETITYVLAGTVEHGDSIGNRGAIGAGDVQWMTAGRGIIHQEMPKGDAAGRMHGFQLWANLPVVAQDDRAPLPGGEGGRHPRDHRRRRHPRPHRLRQLLGQAAARWTASPPTPSTSTSRSPPGQPQEPAGRDHAPRLRLRLRGQRQVLQRLRPPRRAHRRASAGPTPRPPPRPTTARSSSSTAATRSPCRPARTASASCSSPASRSTSRSPGTDRS